VLDDYLEFVDRRYHRLNDEEEESSPPGINTAWNWLMSQKPDSPQKQQRKEEDALYVLGLAGLASEELLQKHHLRLLPARGDHSEGVVIDAKFSSDAPDRPTTQDSMAPVLSYNRIASLTAGMSVLHRAFERRLVIESLRLRSGVYAFIRAMRWTLPAASLSASKSMSLLLGLSGGGKLRKASITFVASLLIFLRPLTKAMSQTA